MKRNFNHEELLQVVEESANTLLKDIEEDNFVSGATVSWLAHKPTSSKELVENLYERLRTLGIRLSVDRHEFLERVSPRGEEDLIDDLRWTITARNLTAEFDSDNIDRQAVGEAAFLRSDYNKQNS